MKLTIVPTPIGNLDDITLRAIKNLQQADLIFSEDTRVTRSLLNHLGITPPKILPFHSNNEHVKVESYLTLFQTHEHVVLVSDAGTPGISDPGFLLIRACIEHGITIETLPGPTALIPALVNSGAPTSSFLFEGFLPHKKGRKTKIESWKGSERTIIFYESPHRFLKALEEMKLYLEEDRRICVARELTKMFEETLRGTVTEVQDYFMNKAIKGEFVIVVFPVA